MRLVRTSVRSLVACSMVALLVGCQTEPRTEQAKMSLETDADATLKKFYIADQSMEGVINNSRGYAVFPSIGKGGLIVGGSYGRGMVYENGSFIGYADLKKVNVGAQAGGQEFAELIVFKDEMAMSKFKTGEYSLAADASAIALKEGAAKSANFKDGVAVFVQPTGGLMFEAAIGGQKFAFVPKQ